MAPRRAGHRRSTRNGERAGDTPYACTSGNHTQMKNFGQCVAERVDDSLKSDDRVDETRMADQRSRAAGNLSLRRRPSGRRHEITTTSRALQRRRGAGAAALPGDVSQRQPCQHAPDGFSGVDTRSS